MHQCAFGLFGTSSFWNWLVFDNQEVNQKVNQKGFWAAEILTQMVYPLFSIFWLLFRVLFSFLATSMACRSSQARDQTYTTALIWPTAVTTLNLNPMSHMGTPYISLWPTAQNSIDNAFLSSASFSLALFLCFYSNFSVCVNLRKV